MQLYWIMVLMYSWLNLTATVTADQQTNNEKHIMGNITFIFMLIFFSTGSMGGHREMKYVQSDIINAHKFTIAWIKVNPCFRDPPLSLGPLIFSN